MHVSLYAGAHDCVFVCVHHWAGICCISRVSGWRVGWGELSWKFP